jgi:hypothetical protein
MGKTTFKDLEFQFRDALLHIFYDVPSIIPLENIRISNYQTPNLRHNYQREKEAYNGLFVLHYNDKKLALLQRRPHKKVTVYQLFDKDRYVQKIMERVVSTYIPDASVEMSYDQ